MGRGDKRTRRGKIFKGSFGVTRPRVSKKSVKPTSETKVIETKSETTSKE